MLILVCERRSVIGPDTADATLKKKRYYRSVADVIVIPWLVSQYEPNPWQGQVSKVLHRQKMTIRPTYLFLLKCPLTSSGGVFLQHQKAASEHLPPNGNDTNMAISIQVYFNISIFFLNISGRLQI